MVIQQAFSGWGDNIVGPTPKTEEAETEPNAVTVPAKKGRKKASGFQFVEFGKKQYVEKKRSEAKVVDKQEAKKRREVEEASSSCSSESVRASESAEPAEPAVAPDDEAEHTVGGDATEDIEPADALTQEASDENDIQRNWVWVKAPSSEEVGVNEAGVIGAVGPAWLDTICLLDLSTK